MAKSNVVVSCVTALDERLRPSMTSIGIGGYSSLPMPFVLLH